MFLSLFLLSAILIKHVNRESQAEIEKKEFFPPDGTPRGGQNFDTNSAHVTVAVVAAARVLQTEIKPFDFTEIPLFGMPVGKEIVG